MLSGGERGPVAEETYMAVSRVEAIARGPCYTVSTSSQPFSTLYLRPAASRTTSCNRSSVPTTPTCAGSRAWAGRHPAPDGSDVRSDGSAPRHCAHPG
eukprot:366494-Chlamydomonas_euryale.AAC.11